MCMQDLCINHMILNLFFDLCTVIHDQCYVNIVKIVGDARIIMLMVDISKPHELLLKLIAFY